jgi:hypothetical protein
MEKGINPGNSVSIYNFDICHDITLVEETQYFGSWLYFHHHAKL